MRGGLVEGGWHEGDTREGDVRYMLEKTVCEDAMSRGVELAGRP